MVRVKASRVLRLEDNFPVVTKDIEDGISVLNKAGVWPSNKAETIPAYTDDSATLYLQILPKTLIPSGYILKTAQTPFLQHPLSLNRSVCFILSPNYSGNGSSLMTHTENGGVKGKITVTSSQDFVVEDVLQNDTIVITLDKFKEVYPLLQKKIEHEPGKAIYSLQLSGRKEWLSQQILNLLTKTFLFQNESNECLMRVGHTGLTSEEIEANVLSALGSLKISRKFPGGWANVQTIGLKTGSSKAVPIYISTEDSINNLVDEKQQKVGGKRKSGQFSEDQKQIWLAKKKREMKEKKMQKAGLVADSLSPGAMTEEKNSSSRKSAKFATGSAEAAAGLKRPLEADTCSNGQGGGSPVKKAKKRKHGRDETSGAAVASPAGQDLVNLLISRALESVSTPKQDKADNVKGTSVNESKKSKKNKLASKVGIVQKDGELSLEFKQKMMASLRRFTLGTEFEDIVMAPAKNVSPVKSGKKALEKAEGLAENSPEVKEAVVAETPANESLKKKKHENKNKSPIEGTSFASPIQANGHSAKEAKTPLISAKRNMAKENKQQADKLAAWTKFMI